MNIRLAIGYSILACAAYCPAAEADSPAVHTYDVVVVGAGPGGVSAALQAARMGARVALLEETDWLGGQMAAAGVSTMDEGVKLSGPQGIYDEFRRRMGAYYAARGKSVSTCYYRNVSHCYEPSAIQKILLGMIADVNRTQNGTLLELFLRHRVVQVQTVGKVVTGVTTQSGERFQAKIVIDATEYGDLLPLSPAAFRSGNNLSTLPPHSACTQFITYVAVIRKYPAGVPADLVMHHAPPGYNATFVDHMRSVMQQDGSPGSRAVPVSFQGFAAYRAVPDSTSAGDFISSDPASVTKTSIDWFNDYPATTDIFDPHKRKDIVCRAKLKTLDVLYFIQHGLGESLWSVANDEGYDTLYNREENSCANIPAEYKTIEHNFPVLPYIRESQRVVGLATLTSIGMRHDGNSLFTGSTEGVALGDYANDMHGCAQEQDMETELEHAGDRVSFAQPFQIPAAALIPRGVGGFLVAEKNLSQSRLASGSSRLQPIAMVTGQAAGALAALSAQSGKQPSEIPVAALQRVLLKSGSSLALHTISDVAANSDVWQAAQFVVLHGWMSMKTETTFGFTDFVTRRELAEILAHTFSLTNDWDSWWAAFGHSALVLPDELEQAPPGSQALYREAETWRHDLINGPRFIDVPLYDPYAPFIESVATRGALSALPENAHTFLPLAPATERDLVRALRVLSAGSPSGTALADADAVKTFDTAHPLTKGVAAKMLYLATSR